MVKFTLIFLAFVMISTVGVAYCGKKGGYGSGKGGKGGCGGGKSNSGKGCGGGGSSETPSEIQAAVISSQTVKIKPFSGSSQTAKVPTIIISSGSSPLNIHFQSASSNLNITQDHSNSKPQVITSSSVDGGIILRQTVRKPILQEISEKIFPERKIVQEIMPVKEFIKTIISQAETTTGGSADESTTAEDEPSTVKPKPKKYMKKKGGKKMKMSTTEAPSSTSTEDSNTSTEEDASDYMLYGKRR